MVTASSCPRDAGDQAVYALKLNVCLVWCQWSGIHDVHSMCNVLDGLDAVQVSSLLHFWVGAHDLPVAIGRWQVDSSTRQHIPRRDRVCPHCVSGVVGDESRMVFECGFYHLVSACYPQLITRFGGYDAVSYDVSSGSSYIYIYI